MAVVTVGMHEAKTHFSRLVRRALEGDDVIVENNGTRVARIVAYEPEPPAPEGAESEPEPPARRVGGYASGTIWIADDFDAPLPEFEALLYGDDR